MNAGAEPFRNLESTMKPQTKRPKPQRFGRQAKTAVTMMAAATLLGGWNLIAHLDRAQAGAAPDNGAKEAPAAESNPSKPNRGATLLPLPTLAPLNLAPIPTLRPAPALAGAPVATTSGAVMTLADLPGLSPLPTLGALPSMPSLPPPPAPSSNGGGGGGGSTTSGGS